MGFGFGGGCDFNRCNDRRDHDRDKSQKRRKKRQ
jgi:hypothetical protein